MQSAGQLDPALWKPFVTDRSVWRDYLVKGLWATLKAAAISIVFAGVFGIVLGLGRLSHIAPSDGSAASSWSSSAPCPCC